MSGDWLDDELAREDHRHGMAYGDDADHCEGCAVEAHKRFQAECEHDGEQVEMLSFGDANRQMLCQRCGLVRKVER